MHARKQLMAERSDAFCALPGGLGTLDETFEIITWRQLKLHDKPVILVNLDGYWDPLLRLVEHQTAAGYLRSEEHTSELQSLMRISYAVFCLKKKKKNNSLTHEPQALQRPQQTSNK